MNSTPPETRWTRMQRGQALMEYWPTIPVAIAIMIIGGVITQHLNGAFLRTADALNRAGLNTEICNLTTETVDGSDFAEMEGHTVQLSSNVYDPVTNTTTVTFTVTSGGDHAISHWVLGIPKAAFDAIIDYPSDELMSWSQPDPTTGLVGVKFDKGYDGNGGGGGKPENNGNNGNNGNDNPKGNNGVGNGEDPQPPGNPPVNDGEGTGPGNPGNKGGSDSSDKGKGKTKARLVLNTRFYGTGLDFSTADSREITLVLAGQWETEPVDVAVKAATDSFYSTISAPTTLVTSEPKEVDPGDLLSMDTLSEGCAE